MEAVDEASGFGKAKVEKEYDEEFDEVVNEMVKKKRLAKLKAEYKTLKSKEEKLENLKQQNKLQVEIGDD